MKQRYCKTLLTAFVLSLIQCDNLCSSTKCSCFPPRTADLWEVTCHTVQELTLKLNFWSETLRLPDQHSGWHCYREKAKIVCQMGNHLELADKKYPQMSMPWSHFTSSYLPPSPSRVKPGILYWEAIPLLIFFQGFKQKGTRDWQAYLRALRVSLPAASSGPFPWTQEPHLVPIPIAAML